MVSELTVLAGDFVSVLEESHFEWWKCKLGERIGFLPVSYLEKVSYMPTCPRTLSKLACEKNHHIVRLRSVFPTFVAR